MERILTPAELLEMLEGNRRLTVRTIQAFPEHDLFHYTPAEPLRPFAEMVREFLSLEVCMMRGILTGDWTYADPYQGVTTAKELLEACEFVRSQTLEHWPEFTAERLLTVDKDPFSGTQPNLNRVVYMIENEAHHRGQAYVYLRMLGMEPPLFYER